MPRQVTLLAGTNFVPGREALDIGWKIVLAHDRDAHTEQRLHQHTVGTGRAGAIRIGNLDRKLVD